MANLLQIHIYYWLKVKHIPKIQNQFVFKLLVIKLSLGYKTKKYCVAILCFVHYSCTPTRRSCIAGFVRKVTFFIWAGSSLSESYFSGVSFTVKKYACPNEKIAMFQHNYMIVLKMTDNLGVSVLLVLCVFSGALT